jgi:putative transposase
MSIVRTKTKKTNLGKITPEEKAIQRIAKNEKIAETKKHNKARRSLLEKKTFELKIVSNKLSQKQKNLIARAFIEARWIKNYCIGSLYPFEVEINDIVLVKTYNSVTQKCDIVEERTLEALGSQIKQDLVKQVQQDIINLGKKKKAGGNVGKLKFCKRS